MGGRFLRQLLIELRKNRQLCLCYFDGFLQRKDTLSSI